VALRQEFSFDGFPDWAGKSEEYRQTIYRAYREAGVPSDSTGALQANLRYHVGNALREAAPADELRALGLDLEGPRARAVRARRKHTRRGVRPLNAGPEKEQASDTKPGSAAASQEKVAQLEADNLRLRQRVGQLESALDILLERMNRAS
jgi:hypothetical protein